MGTRIEVMTDGSVDFSKQGLASRLPVRVFNIDDDSFTAEEVGRIKSILADPIVDVSSVNLPVLSKLPDDAVVIEQTPKPGVTDPDGEETRKVIARSLGREVGQVSFSKQYLWRGELDETQMTLLEKRLGNPAINEFRMVDALNWDAGKGVGFHFPRVSLPKPEAFTYYLTKDRLVLDRNTSDSDLMKISEERLLALNLAEMKAVQGVLADSEFLGKRREMGLEERATDVEAEIAGQTWSEHCIHKKFGAIWMYESDDPNDKSGIPTVTDSVFKSIIKEATMHTARKKPDFVVSIFEDNAGVVRLNSRWNIAQKVETHNHPSGIDGDGGSQTGIGGCIRDPMHTGKFMEVVDDGFSFRAANPRDFPDLPLDIQSPARTLETVVQGVESYGNKMGISTSYGQVMIDRGWIKPGVYVESVAVAEERKNGRLTHTKELEPGQLLYSIGGRVGKDGIHGATASSMSLSADAEQNSLVKLSVQIGGPITQKNYLETMRILHELDLIEASQDCGAGGWNSAVGELTGLLNELEEARHKIQTKLEQVNVAREIPAERRVSIAYDALQLNSPVIGSPFVDTLKEEVATGKIFGRKSNGKGGAVMDLTHAPEKYAGLMAWEKTISEAQERGVIVIKPENAARVREICEHNNVEATQIAVLNDSGLYEVRDQDRTVALLPVEFLHKGLPQMTIIAKHVSCKNQEPEIVILDDLTDVALEMTGRPNMQSYDWINRRYDHEVQGGSRLKPIAGRGKGRSDAVAYKPILEEKEVVVKTQGSNPWQGDIDAYEMGVNAVVDAIGRLVAAGGDLEKMVNNGNTTCPKPEKDPIVAGKVMRMLKGSADAEKEFEMMRISGKDSTGMEREYRSTVTGEIVKVKAKPELLISAMAIIQDDSTITSPDFKISGDLVYVVGDTRDELGASEFYAMHNEVGRNVPVSNLPEIKSRYHAVVDVIKSGVVHSAQYVARGGLMAALENSALGGDLGVQVSIDQIENGLGRADKVLFSETTGRFVLSVNPADKEAFEALMGQREQYCKRIGYVRGDKEFNVKYNHITIVGTDVNTFREKNKGEIRY